MPTFAYICRGVINLTTFARQPGDHWRLKRASGAVRRDLGTVRLQRSDIGNGARAHIAGVGVGQGKAVGLGMVAAGLVAAMALWSGAAAAQVQADLLQRASASAEARKEAIERGRKVATFCANCHGEKGLSKFPEVPNLAGQNPIYVLRQIDAFAAGRRRNEFMQGLVKALEPAERVGVALYFSTLAVTPSEPVAAADAASGARQFARVCARCHGPQALGGEEFPRLAGQQADYLRLNLQRYLHPNGERTFGAMTAAVVQLGERNIEPVVHYLSSLRPE